MRSPLRYWKAAGVDLDAKKGAWYKDTGSGMGPTLNTASAMNGYVLADRGTWLSFKNRGELAILVEGDSRLFNQYGVMLVNPAKHPHVKKDLGQQFVERKAPGAGRAPGDLADQHAHAEGFGQFRHRAAQLAVTEQAKGLAFQLDNRKVQQAELF